MTMDLKTFGIASTSYVRCLCGLALSAGAEMRLGREDKVALVQPGAPYKNKVNATDFLINHKLLLGFQLCGLGRTKAKIIRGMLNLANNPMAAHITPIQQELGLAILQLGNEVLEENLEREKILARLAWTKETFRSAMMLAGIKVVLVDGMICCQDAQSCLAIEVDSLSDWHQCQCAVFLVRRISPTTPTFVHTTTKAHWRKWRKQGQSS
jgi:hypothetical protein